MKIGDSINMFGNMDATSAKKQKAGGTGFDELMNIQDSSSDAKLPDDIKATVGSRTALSPEKSGDDARHQDMVDELHKWANMNPAEMIRAKYLEARGMSEDDLAKLPPDERKAIEDEIKKQVEEQAKQEASSSASKALSALSL